MYPICNDLDLGVPLTHACGLEKSISIEIAELTLPTQSVLSQPA